LECVGCGIKDELVVDYHLIIPKNLGGMKDPSNQVLLCANCERKISIIGENFRTEFIRLSKIGIYKEPNEFRLITELPDKLKEILLKEIEVWIKKMVKNGKISIKY